MYSNQVLLHPHHIISGVVRRGVRDSRVRTHVVCSPKLKSRTAQGRGASAARVYTVIILLLFLLLSVLSRGVLFGVAFSVHRLAAHGDDVQAKRIQDLSAVKDRKRSKRRVHSTHGPFVLCTKSAASNLIPSSTVELKQYSLGSSITERMKSVSRFSMKRKVSRSYRLLPAKL